MKSLKAFLAFLLMWPLLFSCTNSEKNRLCGTWRMIEGTYIGPDFSVTTTEEDRICYKIISQNHISVVEMYKANPDSQFFAAVGTYTLSDSTYTEYYEASNLPSKMGEKFEFHSIIEDKKWTIKLETDDLQLEETWVCTSSPGENIEL